MKHSHLRDSSHGGQRKRLGQAALVAVILGAAVLVAVSAAPRAGEAAIPPTVSAGGSAETAKQAPLAPNDISNYGFFMSLIENNGQLPAMGFNWVEYGIFWSDEEPSPGQYSWLTSPGANNVDNIVNGARNANVNLLIRISRTPSWARDSACSGSDTCPPSNAADFGNFAGALAAHVRANFGRSVAYEIWNEPNTGWEWGLMCPDPARYTNLLRQAYPRIKSGDNTATVLGGAVTTVGQIRDDVCFMDDLQFIQGMYDAGAKPYFDALADHPYGFIAAPEADPLTSPSALLFRRAERHHDYMVANGDGSKKIWATEMGWAIDPASEGLNCPPSEVQWYQIFNQQQQSDYLVRALQWARSYWPWMQAMFIWNYDFNQASWYSQCNSFRFFSVKGRIAQNALRNFRQSPPPTYTPAVDNPPSITATRYSTTSLPRTGGSITVDVDVSDADSTPVQSVSGVLSFPGGGTQVYNLTLVSGTTQNGTWRTTLTIPENTSGGVQTYSFQPYAVEQAPPQRTTYGPVQNITVTLTRFSDVPLDFWAYEYIEYLAAHGIINGYPDGTFKPGNNATRAQLSKIVVLAFQFPLISPPSAHFADVAPGSTFYSYVETAYSRGLVSGYPCGGPGEPCVGGLPYFRPNNPVTRAQIAKIIVIAAAWPVITPPASSFQDVAPGSTFYSYVETAVQHGIISGYACGGPGEPCGAGNKPYFRPGFNASRAQISKMVYLALEGPGSGTPTVAPSTTPPRKSSAFATGTPSPTPTATGTPMAKLK